MSGFSHEQRGNPQTQAMDQGHELDDEVQEGIDSLSEVLHAVWSAVDATHFEGLSLAMVLVSPVES